MDWSSTLSAQNVTFGNGNVSGTATTVTTPGAATDHDDTRRRLFHHHHHHAGRPEYGIEPGSKHRSGGLSASTISGLIPTTGFLNADGVKAVISFLNASYDAQVVSTPRVVTLDNETAHIEVIRTYPDPQHHRRHRKFIRQFLRDLLKRRHDSGCDPADFRQ